MGRNENRIARILKGVQPLGEKDRIFRNFRVGFFSMPAIVQPDSENLRGQQRGKQILDIGGTVRGSQL